MTGAETSQKIVFMGTPDFAACALRAIHDAGLPVAAVYTQPPRPKGRGQQVQKSPVHMLAEVLGLPVFTPARLKDPAVQAEFAAHEASVAVVAAYGLILPQQILDAPRHGCINIHASLLPRWRGASPIQQAILAGDKESGVSLMRMDAGLDTGPVLAQQAVPITETTTAPLLHDALAALGAEMTVKLLHGLARDGGLPPEMPQPQTGVTYAPLLDKQAGRIDWSGQAEEIARLIRAFNPWPGVWTMLRDRRIKITAAKPEATKTGDAPGTVLDKSGLVVCGGGALRVLTVQPEGKTVMDFAAAVNGGLLKPGDRFS